MTFHSRAIRKGKKELKALQEKLRLCIGARRVLWRIFNANSPTTHQIPYFPPEPQKPEAISSKDPQAKVAFLQLYNPETGDMFFFPEYALDELINRSPNPKAMRNVIEYLAQFMSEHGDHDKSLDTILKYGDPDDREIIAYFCKLASYEGYAKVRPLGRGRTRKVLQSGSASGVPHPELVEPS